VEIPPEQRTDIHKGLSASVSGSFTRLPSLNTNDTNWGLLRSSYKNNPFNGSDVYESNFNYSLDGTGVDIVILDSGVDPNHPEWNDANGVSRYTSVDWGAVHGGFTQHSNHDRDYDGHGTHCAGIAAGKTFGWAKNAKIYSLKLSGIEGSGDSGTGISESYAFDAIKLWHRAKPRDPATGFKRPTVVNMSFMWMATFNGGSTAYSVIYRGTQYSSTDIQNNFDGELRNFGLNEHSSTIGVSGTWKHPIRVASIDTDVEEMVDDGIHVCIAAGNNYTKVDVEGGQDYDNQALINNTVWRYYHRGGSPWNENALIVGSMNHSQVLSGSAYIDQRSYYSNHGPGVDLYAPGNRILSTVSETNSYSSGAYYYDNDHYVAILNGTSMAAPQAAGVVALYAQSNPGLTPARMKAMVIANAGTTIYNPTEGISGSNSLQGGEEKTLYNKYSDSQPLQFEGSFTSTADLNF
jgi:subtilisin family serine protease